MTVAEKAGTSETGTDRIEKRFEVKAPLAKVWRAISDATEFQAWFRLKLDGAFAEGRTVKGNVSVPGYEHFKVELQVVRIEPQRYFAYRWHPYPADPKVDYSKEPTTLVEFTLEETPAGVAVTIVESGFDQLPVSRRAEAFRMNEGGWKGQTENLRKYVE